MRVQDLQEFLGSFTEGSEAVKNAVIFAKRSMVSYMRYLDVWKYMKMFNRL